MNQNDIDKIKEFLNDAIRNEGDRILLMSASFISNDFSTMNEMVDCRWLSATEESDSYKINKYYDEEPIFMFFIKNVNYYGVPCECNFIGALKEIESLERLKAFL